MARIAPSLLSADFGAFADAVASCEHGGADALHFDVMDGQFVPNISYGAYAVRALRGRSTLEFDVHLMVVEPDRMVQEFAEAGSDCITVHVEACRHLQRTLAIIRQHGPRVGVALNPATPLEALTYVLDDVDRVLVMSVNPGFSGQAFIPQCMDKVRRLRELIDARALSIEISVDGGVGERNARCLAEAGAGLLVAGSSAFGHPEGVVGGIAALRRALEGG